MQDPTTSPSSSSQVKSNKRPWALGALLVGASAALAVSLGAWAAAGQEGGACMPHQMMMGMHGGGHGGMDGMMPMPFSGRHLNHLLDKADATAGQREQIKQLLDKTQSDMKALHEEGRTLHEQALKLWAQPVLDATAAEKLRQLMLAHHDKCSKRLMLTMLDIGHILTPEQRAKVSELMQKHHAEMMAHMSASQPGDGPGRKDHDRHGDHQSGKE